MHKLLSLKFKIFLIALLTIGINYAANSVVQESVTIRTVLIIVELVILYVLCSSWNWIVSLLEITKINRCFPFWVRNNLNGEWEGEILSQWKKSEQDSLPPPIPVSLTIYQGWQDIRFNMSTAKMTSKAYGAYPVYDSLNQELQIYYFYKTNPTIESSRENPPQNMGSAIATIKSSEPDSIKIQYTNERGRGGDIILTRKKISTTSS